MADLVGSGLLAHLPDSELLTCLAVSKLLFDPPGSGLSVSLFGCGLWTGLKVCEVLVVKLVFWILPDLIGSGLLGGIFAFGLVGCRADSFLTDELLFSIFC